jgi:hypothetical protein
MSEVRVPFPDPLKPEHTIADVHAAIRKTPELNDEERQVAEAIAYGALTRGTTQAAELDKELKGPDARRIVDEARESIGLRTIAAEEADRRWERVNANLPPGRDADGRIFQVCAAQNCNVWPMTEMGVPMKVADRVWWCDRHKDQAGPDDHLPPEVKYVLDFATMSPRAVGAERERLLEEDRERERKAAERTRRRREEAKALREIEDRYVEQAKPINIGGWLVDGKGRIVDDR